MRFLGMLAKKIAHFLSSRDRGWGGGRQYQNCLQNPKIERFFLFNWGKNQPKKSLIFEDLKTKGGRGAAIWTLSSEEKI